MHEGTSRITNTHNEEESAGNQSGNMYVQDD